MKAKGKYKFPVIRLKSLGDVIYSMVTVVNNIAYLKVAKRVHLKNSHHKKLATMYGDGC